MKTEQIQKSSAFVTSSQNVFQSLGVIGAGAWGTALAACASRAGRDVKVWAREPEVAKSLAAGEGNPQFLSGVELPILPASSEIADFADRDALLIVTPAQFLDASLSELAKVVRPDINIALCAKGILQDGLRLPTEALAQHLPNAKPAVLSGPSFAADVSRGLPTAVTLACEDRNTGETWANTVGQPNFRIYWSDDLIGAEVGGAIKNVLAIACGACEGLELGKSAHAALIARGFAEMQRLAIALGGKRETVAGLSGLGDLVLTCSSPQSRNMSFGFALGQGQSPQAILEERKTVTEGAASAPAVMELARKHDVDMPICDIVNELVAGNLTAKDAMRDLLNRPFKEESA